jgi:2-keto-4-pentenoate hydratase/2-oxohepta-3-ene-1,7-dioic acid hydratase in catechol pathway
VNLLPIPRPSKIVCVGRNYVDHAKELGNEVPKAPLLFFKPASALVGAGAPIVLPRASQQVEYEAEIGVVVGRVLRYVDSAAAEAGIRGFICANDVTARDLQKSDGQWARAKGFDSFCPVGPKLVEGPPWQDLEIIGRLNGIERQRGKATQMVFGIPELLSYISTIMTLEPGDLVLTGTPAGVGPLQPGDVFEVEIPGVGLLSNPVVAESR